MSAIDAYLTHVQAESRRRGFNFAATKIDEAVVAELEKVERPEPHPLFLIPKGVVRNWEKTA